jgi:hypothetical protein
VVIAADQTVWQQMGAAAGVMDEMDPLHATIEEFAADGYTHLECIARDVA